MKIEPVFGLCCAVIRQAVDDWRDLLRKGSDECSLAADNFYSKAEIAEFLRSDWCRLLLEESRVGTTGKRILRQLESEQPA